MKGDTLNADGLVEDGIVDGGAHALQFLLIAAVVGVDGRFVDREIEEGSSFDATHFGFFRIR